MDLVCVAGKLGVELDGWRVKLPNSRMKRP